MARFNLGPIGKNGWVYDTAASELPDLYWSEAVNIRFADGMAYQADGITEYTATVGSVAYFVYGVPRQDSGSDYIFFRDADGQKVFDPTLTDLSVADVTAVSFSASLAPSGADFATLLNGILVVTHESGPPFSWVFPPDPATKMVELTNWTSTHQCKVIVAFRQHLFALNMTENGVSFPYRVKWSDPAAAGNLPLWDEGDPAGDAGTFDLIEGGDAIIGGLPLKDQLFIYKENSTWSARYVGGGNIWEFSQVFNGWGLIGKNAVCEANGHHYVMTRSDIIEHNGYETQSIAYGFVKKYLNEKLDPNKGSKAHVVHDAKNQSVLFGFSQAFSESYFSELLAFNYISRSWSVVKVPLTYSLANANIEYRSSTVFSHQPKDQIVGGGLTFFRLDAEDFDDETTSSARTSVLTRVGWPLAGYRRSGEGPTRDTRIKYVKRIWPQMSYRKTTVGADCNFYVGGRFKKGDAIAWSGPYGFNPETDEKIDLRVSGREISIRVTFPINAGAVLESMDIEFDVDSSF